jgi:DNA polymerase III delta subunit
MTVSETKKKYNKAWDDANMQKYTIKVKNDLGDAIRSRAAELGKPISRYSVDLIKEDLGEI